MTLTEALTHYMESVAHKANAFAHQELNHFGRALGWERPVEKLMPPEVATYAEAVVAAGGDVHGRLAPVKEFLAYLNKKGFSSRSLAPHVKIPRAAVRTAPAATVADSEAIQMTAVGHKLLADELKELKGMRVGIAEAIGRAAADKDFSENAPLDAAREHQGKTEARIRELEETLRRSVVIGKARSNAGEGIRVGTKVRLHDLSTGKDTSYTLVDSAEADPLAFKISVASPVGMAVIGRGKGDEVTVQTPKGERHYRIAQADA